MTTKKSTVKAGQHEGVAGADKIELARDEWDFRACPEQLWDNCWNYELGREIAREVPEVFEAAALLRTDPKTKDKSAFITFAQMRLREWPDFPIEPWLTHWNKATNEEKERRKKLAELGIPMLPRVPYDEEKARVPKTTPKGFKTGQLKDLAGKDQRIINPIQIDFPDYPVPDPEYNKPIQVGVYQVDWRFNTDQLIEDFRQWLIAARPVAFQGLKKPGRKADPREMLKWLGVYRLSKAKCTAKEINKKTGDNCEDSVISRVKGKLQVIIDREKEPLRLSTLSLEELKAEGERLQTERLKQTQGGS